MLLASKSFCVKRFDKQAWARLTASVPRGNSLCYLLLTWLPVVACPLMVEVTVSMLLERMSVFYLLLTDRPSSGHRGS